MTATQLFQSEDATVSQIANDLGFGSASTFASAFIMLYTKAMNAIELSVTFWLTCTVMRKVRSIVGMRICQWYGLDLVLRSNGFTGVCPVLLQESAISL